MGDLVKIKKLLAYDFGDESAYCIDVAFALGETVKEIERLREALAEALACLNLIVDTGYAGAPDISMRRAARTSLEKINEALTAIQSNSLESK